MRVTLSVKLGKEITREVMEMKDGPQGIVNGMCTDTKHEVQFLNTYYGPNTRLRILWIV